MGDASAHLRNYVVLYDTPPELQKFRDALKKGDKVVTIGGIYGTVVELKDKSVLIEVDKDVKIRVDRNALQGDFSESEAASK